MDSISNFYHNYRLNFKSNCPERHAEAAIPGGDDETDGRGEGGDGGAADGDAEESGGDWEGSLMENTLNTQLC